MSGVSRVEGRSSSCSNRSTIEFTSHHNEPTSHYISAIAKGFAVDSLPEEHSVLLTPDIKTNISFICLLNLCERH